jgi:HPt (histidine-containing phosphotransfer) domain-containing protein
MTNLTGNSFIFSDGIDTAYLNSLYGDDYIYLQEVFDTVLKDYKSLTDNIDFSYTSGDRMALRAAVHKIKPVFGFVGLTAIQTECQEFEDSCNNVSFENLARDFELLKEKLTQSRYLLEEEKKKLEIFNRHSS